MILYAHPERKARQAGPHSNGVRSKHVGARTPASEDMTPSAMEQIGSDSSRRELVTRAAEILDEMCREIRRGPREARQAALRLVTLLKRPSIAEAAITRGGLAPWQAQKIERYLRAQLREQMPVRELARHTQLSVSHFCRAFKETFGRTPHAYILRLRIELAQELMLSTRDPLTQIAFECGFADLSHLSKAFRREIGEPPSTWRRRNLVDPQAGSNGHGTHCSL
jgi:AraC family transcriptional regulator